MVTALLTGTVAGVLHVLTGPDHVVAVSPFAVDGAAGRWKVGSLWGIGHTVGVAAIAAVALFFRHSFNVEILSAWGERIVGVVLIVIGLWCLHKALEHRFHFHPHEHEGQQHAHFHWHRHTHETEHNHSHAPLGIGLLHGVAGGPHIVAVLPTLVFPGPVASVSYLLGFALGSIATMTTVSWLLGRSIARWVHRYSNAYSVVLGAFALVAIGVGIVWLRAS